MHTRVGYAGGTLKDPTYHNLGDHSESIRIEFDPAQISYAKLLDIFWSTHNPCARAGSRQYMSAIFYNSEAQKKLALETRDREQSQRGHIVTDILPAREFYPAEDYHQKYMLRQHSALMTELRALYPTDDVFVASTAAARLNAFVAGDASFEQLKSELARLDLPPDSLARIVKLAESR